MLVTKENPQAETAALPAHHGFLLPLLYKGVLLRKYYTQIRKETVPS